MTSKCFEDIFENKPPLILSTEAYMNVINEYNWKLTHINL